MDARSTWMEHACWTTNMDVLDTEYARDRRRIDTGRISSIHDDGDR